MSHITEAVETMQGAELLVFLTTFDYQEPSDENAAPERPEFGSEEYGAYYNDVQDAGVMTPEPDTWSEVEYLRATGKLNREVYYQVLEARLGQAGRAEEPAAE